MDKKNRKERRAESDARIIASAIRCFGNRGYSFTTLADIAKDAGVTGPLLSQRYGSKENLFLAAYREAIAGVFTEMDADASPRDCLCTIIKDIERLHDADPVVFAFCGMLHDAADYPREILIPLQEEMKKTNSYHILTNAQEKGMLPAGNPDILLASFGAMVFHNVALCRRYGMEYFAPEKYLDFIRFSDAATRREAKWYRILEAAITNTFELLVYVDIPGNTGEILRCSDPSFVYGDFTDARRDIELTIRKVASGEELQMLREFVDLETLGERLKGRKSVSLQSRQEDGNVLVHSILPVSWDENGTLKEVFAGVYRKSQDDQPR